MNPWHRGTGLEKEIKPMYACFKPANKADTIAGKCMCYTSKSHTLWTWFSSPFYHQIKSIKLQPLYRWCKQN